MKKILSSLLATTLMVSVLSACNQNQNTTTTAGSANAPTTTAGGKTETTNSGATTEVQGEPDHYKIMSVFRPQHEDFAKMPVVDQILKDANVTVEWELVGDAAAVEKKNLAISTGNMPDAILGLVTESDVQKNTELFLPLNEYIESMPNISKLMTEKPEAKTYLTFPDGNIYSFPFVQEREYEGFHDQLWINQTWLTNLGLEMPKTYEEYADVLRAFKNDDPNGNGEQDEIPLTMMIKHNYFGPLSMYGMFGRVDELIRLVVEDEKIVFTADKEEWKNATKWFSGLYAEGLVDPETFTQDRSMLFAKGKADPMLIGSSNAFLLDNVVGANRMTDYAFVLLEGPNGTKELRYNSFPIQSRSNSVVNADIENPEGLMRFFDTCLDAEKNYSLQSIFGLIGKQILPTTAEGKDFEFAIAPEGLSQDDYRYKDAPGNFPTFLSVESWNSVVHAPDVARKEAILEEVRPYLQKESMPPLLFTQEETDKLADIQTAIQDYVAQQQSLWMTNQSNIDAEWDNYLATLKAMGVEDYVAIYQAAYDRYYQK